jgi:hypothetical protein
MPTAGYIIDGYFNPLLSRPSPWLNQTKTSLIPPTNSPGGFPTALESCPQSCQSVPWKTETKPRSRTTPTQPGTPGKEESSDETATEDNPGATQRSIFGFVRPFARKSASSTIRSSTASSVGLATVADLPPVPDLRQGGLAVSRSAAQSAAPGSNLGISDAETIAPLSPRVSDTPSPARTRSDASHTTLPGGPLRDILGSVATASGGKPSVVASVNHLSQEGSGPSSDPLSGFEWDVPTGQKAKSFVTRWFVEWWLLEIISWVFSAIYMSIILSVLLHFNGRSLPEWKLGLTLNSFISILSGFAKASLLLPTAQALGQLKWNWFRKPRQLADFEIIDSASRGPLGSMILLASTKGM